MNIFKRWWAKLREKKPCIHGFRQSDVLACCYERLYGHNKSYPIPRCIKCGEELDDPKLKAL